jgi:hypothetical protein
MPVLRQGDYPILAETELRRGENLAKVLHTLMDLTHSTLIGSIRSSALTCS